MTFTEPVIIGLEIHAELNTKSKLFCSCAAHGSDMPNTRCCDTCLGMPGSKPLLNQRAVEAAVLLAKALNCSIAAEVVFSRKSYFYPDLAKNYQITQYEHPIGSRGFIEVDEDRISIQRVHIEEDPGALVHPKGIGKAGHVLVDYNRSGKPLCEIVTGPDIHSPAKARALLKHILTILQYLGIHSPDAHILKTDANVSIRESGYIRSEVKNITGFKEIERALAYEISRHQNLVAAGRRLRQETRSWDAAAGMTKLLRIKETEEDYGYIFDPDLVPIILDQEWLKGLAATMPELPAAKRRRYTREYGLSKADAEVITNDFGLAQVFENTIKKVDPVLAARWVRRELARVLNYAGKQVRDLNLEEFISLLLLIEEKKITDTTAKELLEKLVKEQDIVIKEYVRDHGLESLRQDEALRSFCTQAINENPGAVEDYKKGKAEALNFLMGQVMKKSRGKADAGLVRKILKQIM